MTYRGIIGWVPLVIVVGCNAKLFEQNVDPDAGRRKDAPSNVGESAGTSGDMTNPMDGSIGSGGTAGSDVDASRRGAGILRPAGSTGIGRWGADGWVSFVGAGGSGDDGTGSGDSAVTHGPRCHGVPSTCGAFAWEDCCSVIEVPSGTFWRDGLLGPSAQYDFTNPNAIGSDGGSDFVFATVRDFSLDTYEVTVARFREFVLDQEGHAPPAGSGKNPNDPQDPGWDASWNDTFLAILSDARRAELTRDLNCSGLATWHEAPDDKFDDVPINCVDWYEAYAFCIWDGGRLPTEVEWHYAAEGGALALHYPWSRPTMNQEVIDSSYAVYSPYADRPGPVGESPKGKSWWGHADLAGNVAEWLRDGSRDATHTGYYPATCNDCFNDFKDGRQTAGGSFLSDAAALHAMNRSSADADTRLPGIGVRCAR